MPAKRSPWFNARTEPPVNGGRDATYEHRCLSHPLVANWRPVRKLWTADIKRIACDRCQWRGLLREDGGKA